MFCNLRKQLSCSALSLGPILVCVPLLMSAGCTTDATEDESSTAQAVSDGNCHIQRPYGWETPAAVCSEGPVVPSGTIFILGPGQTHQFFTQKQTVGLGSGWVDVTCDANGDGRWVVGDLICTPEDGETF